MKKEFFVLALLPALFLPACSKNTMETNNKSSSPEFNESSSSELNESSSQQSQEKEENSWVLVDSEISYVSVKTNKSLKNISESGEISALSGEIDSSGNLQMPIDLNSLTSEISIRDYRIKEWLFESDKFPTAMVTSQIDVDVIKNLKPNQSITLNQPLVLDIHNQKINLDSELIVSKTDDKIHVRTEKPVILDISQTDMQEGLQKLVEVMGLASISEEIPITFSGTFTSH